MRVVTAGGETFEADAVVVRALGCPLLIFPPSYYFAAPVSCACRACWACWACCGALGSRAPPAPLAPHG